MASSVNASRGWLEVFKFLSPQELLLIDAVCVQWKEWSRRDEVWQPHLLIPPRAPHQSLREVYRQQVFRPQPSILAYFGMVDQLNLLACGIKLRNAPEDLTLCKYAGIAVLPNKIFVCGGCEGMKSLSTCFMFHTRSHKVKQLPNIAISRGGIGIVYFYGALFVFGGYNDELYGKICKMLRNCEKFTLSTKQWAALPDMQCGRCAFSPARVKLAVYIAGGYGSDYGVEVFSLASETFAKANFFLDFYEDEATVIASDRSLVIINSNYVTQYHIETGQRVNKIEKNQTTLHSVIEAIVYKGEAYFMSNGRWKLSQNLALELVDF